MPDLAKRVASRPSVRWKCLTFGTSATWVEKGTASGKRDCPNLVRRGTGLGQLHPQLSISTYRGGLARSVAALGLPPRWPLGNCVHDEPAQLAVGERRASSLPYGLTRHLGVSAPRWP